MENLVGLMGRCIKDIGKMENNTVEALTEELVALRGKVNGMKDARLNGLMNENLFICGVTSKIFTSSQFYNILSLLFLSSINLFTFIYVIVFRLTFHFFMGKPTFLNLLCNKGGRRTREKMY